MKSEVRRRLIYEDCAILLPIYSSLRVQIDRTVGAGHRIVPLRKYMVQLAVQ